MTPPAALPASLHFRLSNNRYFWPRGFQHITTHGGFSTFHPDYYDEGWIEDFAEGLAARDFNTVRVFAGATSLGNTEGNEISTQFIKNVADFIKRMSAHGLWTILLLDHFPHIPRYMQYYVPDPLIPDHEHSYQWWFLNRTAIGAKQHYIRDYLQKLKERVSDLDKRLFAVELENEFHAIATTPPFVNTPTDFQWRNSSYNLADASGRRRLLDDAATYFFNKQCSAVEDELPGVMVSCSTIPPKTWGRESYADTLPPNDGERFRLPVSVHAMARSRLSYIDVHFKHWDFNQTPSALVPDVVASMNWEVLIRDCRRAGKPILAGEFGGVYENQSEPGAEAAASVSPFWDAVRGNHVSGFVYWTYQRAQLGQGRVYEALAQLVRPDPLILGAPFYFGSNGSMWYTDGYKSSHFLTPDTYMMHRKAYGEWLDLGEISGIVGPNAGLAHVPAGYFNWNGTVFYSEGGGHFVSFPDLEDWQAHSLLHPNALNFGTFEATPFQPPLFGGEPWQRP